MANDIVRVAVVSDSHGAAGAAEKLARSAGRVDRLFHLGDHAREAEMFAEAVGAESFLAVRGNCDGRDEAETTEMAYIFGHRIMLTHGHEYNVKTSLLRLSLAAQEMEVEAVLFGHTHQSAIDFAGGMLMVNPGSISRPRLMRPSFAILEITRDRIAPKIVTL